MGPDTATVWLLRAAGLRWSEIGQRFDRGEAWVFRLRHQIDGAPLDYRDLTVDDLVAKRAEEDQIIATYEELLTQHQMVRAAVQAELKRRVGGDS